MITLTLYLITGTDLAYLFSPRPSGSEKGAVWLPRSQIHRVLKHPANLGEWQRCEVVIPFWLAKKNNLL